jgi:hypothetical protein
MNSKPEQPVSPRAVAGWFGVTPQAIHNWARRGVTWTDHDGNQRTLEPADFEGPREGARYWLSDLRCAEKAAREQTQRSHRKPRELAPA